MGELDEIIKEFLVESNEGLDQVDCDLVALEKQPDDKELIARIFRAVHTLKGTSGILGFPLLESVTHAGESLLSRIRDGRLPMTPAIASALLSLIDFSRRAIQRVESNGSDSGEDGSSLVEQLRSLTGVSPSIGASADVDLYSGQPETHRLGEILVEDGHLSQQAVHEALAQQQSGDSRKIGEILVGTGTVVPKAVVQALGTQADVRSASSASTIRVDVAMLDRVMNLVGELVLARNRTVQFAATSADAGFLSTVQSLNLITAELQEGVMKMRMLAIGNVWNKLPRLVRDMAQACGKQVRIEVDGSETELDKTIIEAIKDPLTHIVRNAIDHGIESPEERRNAGKPVEGVISLRAFHEGGYVNLNISDDGGGIDVERVKAKALARGLMSSEQLARASEREILPLVFVPGFSTAEKVTNISGRGVGMDVVKTNIEKIGGTVDIHSKVGQGTSLQIKIPLTLAIVPALVVTSHGERFAIPQVSLVELVRLDATSGSKQIENVRGAEVYRLRGNLLPLVRLDRQLGVEDRSATDDNLQIVVLQADGRQFGLLVDEINDTEEIVVKPLGKHLKNGACFAGATTMGDGRVALILDVRGLAQEAHVVSENQRAMHGESLSAVANKEDRQQWLLFKAGANARMAMPLSSVQRLEEIRKSDVERSDNQDVVQYRGQIMPLVNVAESFRLEQATSSDPLEVIVHAHRGQSVGFVVSEVLDVVDQTVVPELSGGRAMLGTAVIQQRVTDIVDIDQLAEMALKAAAQPSAALIGA